MRKPRRRKNKHQMRRDYDRYLNGAKWQTVRRGCLHAAGCRCEVCGTTEAALVAHHYNYKRFTKETPDDVFCLCRKCHESYHRIHPGRKLPKDTDVPRHERLDHIRAAVTGSAPPIYLSDFLD